MADTNSTARDIEPRNGLLENISNYIHEEKENIGRTSKTLDGTRKPACNHLIERKEGEDENWL
jgi:hypothetical protein